MRSMGDEFLVHHGIKGQRWGIRRFQNEDGTRTAAGKARERNGEQGSAPASNSSSSQRKGLTDQQKAALKKVAIAAGVAAAAGLAVYGASQYSDALKTAAFNKSVESGKEAIRSLNKDSLYKGVMISEGLSKYQRINLSDWYDAVNRSEFEDVMDTAHENSSSVKAAIKTLRGHGQMSTPELKKMGISTSDTHREEFEDALAKLVYNEKRK